MPSPTPPEPTAEWPADDAEMEIDMSDEDEFEFDTSDADDELTVDSGGRHARSAGSVPVWRLIEMSREDRFLRRELADFEDYDNYDRYTDDYAGVTH